jgi:hypothetical protein
MMQPRNTSVMIKATNIWGSLLWQYMLKLPVYGKK